MLFGFLSGVLDCGFFIMWLWEFIFLAFRFLAVSLLNSLLSRFAARERDIEKANNSKFTRAQRAELLSAVDEVFMVL
jgi:hypothetical protein